MLLALERQVKSHPSRGAWIEIKEMIKMAIKCESHPSRGAWIEIQSNMMEKNLHAVAPLTGCVD